MKNSVQIKEVLINKEWTSIDGYRVIPVIAKLESGDYRTFDVYIRDDKFSITDIRYEAGNVVIPEEFVEISELVNLYDEKIWEVFISNVKSCLEFIIRGNIADFYHDFGTFSPVILVEIKPHFHYRERLCYVFR